MGAVSVSKKAVDFIYGGVKLGVFSCEEVYKRLVLVIFLVGSGGHSHKATHTRLHVYPRKISKSVNPFGGYNSPSE